jgi:hypothetical protein
MQEGSEMARHNREARGTDQRGSEYIISYQPDWLHQVKVSRDLDSGRQSTKILFRNEEPAQAAPGRGVRTRIVSEELGIDVWLTVEDGEEGVRRLSVETIATRGPAAGETVCFTVTRRRPGGG